MKADASSRERILFHLKTKGPQTTAELSRRLGRTRVAMRQQLERLLEEQQVAFVLERGQVGRPARRWRLTAAGHGSFPESYAELSVSLLAALRTSLGPAGLGRLIATRTQEQLAAYRARMGAASELGERVALLTRLRKEEGYMAGWSRHADGSFSLVENHCPICAAAEACQGLCDGELELFQRCLGPGVRVTREEHLLQGARRCRYRIQSREAKSE